MNSQLDNIRTLLNLEVGEQDKLLTLLLGYANSTVALYVGSDEIPNALKWVAEQLTIRKFNKIGEEGVKTSNYEGIAMEYEEDELKPFREILDRYVELHPYDTVSRGRIRML